MSFSKGGKSTANTSTTTSTTSRNLNLQDLEGINVGEAGGDITIVSSDMNAFDNASDLARRSLEVGEFLAGEAAAAISRGTGEAFDFSSRVSGDAFAVARESQGAAFDFGLDAQSRAFDVSSDALATVAETGSDALSQVRDAFSAAGTLVADLFRDSLSFVGATQTRQQESLGETVTALNTIAREQSKSTDERVAEVSAGAQRNIVIIVGVVVVGAIAYGIFARGR